MVSTRGVKVKFVDGERVLCYEPDPTKAKVLYDSKVLEVKVTKDSRGRKITEYLIHFQGWNSSWDRCVSEDYVLKDTSENRQLQRDLAAKAQLQLGAYLYRRDKKRPRKSSEKDNQECVSEDSASPGVETDTQSELTESEMSGDEDGLLDASPGENETITPVIEITANLRALAEFDFEMIKQKNKLLRIPVEPNVVQILESFMRRFATNQMCCDNTGSEIKHKTRQRINSHSNKTFNITLIYQHLNVCREYLDGIRIYFDHTLCDLLLYNPEKTQALAITSTPPVLNINSLKNEPNIKTEPSDNVDIKLEENSDEVPKLSENNYFFEESINNNKRFHSGIGRRCLRSSRVSQHSESQDGLDTNGYGPGFSNRSSIASTESDASGPLSQVVNWKLIIETAGNKHLPCFNYGAVHLLRLIIKLPELLMASSIPNTKMKTVLQLTDNLVDFLDEHPEWFSEKNYIDNKNVLNNN